MLLKYSQVREALLPKFAIRKSRESTFQMVTELVDNRIKDAQSKNQMGIFKLKRKLWSGPCACSIPSELWSLSLKLIQ